MNRILPITLFLLIVICFNLNAQDVIILRNGKEMNVRVTEIGPISVKYKSQEDSTTIFAILKSQIFMIKYVNGASDVFANTSLAPKPDTSSTANYNNNLDDQIKKQVEQGVKDYLKQESYDKNMMLYKSKHTKGIVCTVIGVPFLVGGMAMVGVGVSYLTMPGHYSGGSYYSDGNALTGILLTVIGAALGAAGIPLTVSGPVNIVNSFKYKRKANEAKTAMSFEPMLRPVMASGITTMVAGGGVQIKF